MSKVEEESKEIVNELISPIAINKYDPFQIKSAIDDEIIEVIKAALNGFSIDPGGKGLRGRQRGHRYQNHDRLCFHSHWHHFPLLPHTLPQKHSSDHLLHIRLLDLRRNLLLRGVLHGKGCLLHNQIKQGIERIF